MMYEYSCRIVDVMDGDTLRVDVDLGFGLVLRRLKIRLNRINAPERSTPEGCKAAAMLRTIAMEAPCVVKTFKDKTEKYGRYLAEVTIPSGENLSDWMIAKGYAASWDGQGQRPVPVVKGGEHNG